MLDERIQKTTIDADDWHLGSGEAPCFLLEYFDYECPRSAELQPVLQRVFEQSGGELQIVVRHFPVQHVDSPSLRAAEAAEAAGAQGRFWDMHQRLFAQPGRLTHEDLLEHARALGLDYERFEKDLEHHHHQDKVLLDVRRGVRDDVSETPTIFINLQRYEGPLEVEAILTMVRRLREISPWIHRRGQGAPA